MINPRTVVAIITLCFIIGTIWKMVSRTTREKFDPAYVTDKPTYIESVETITNNPEVLSNGYVQKHKEDGSYTYSLYFNLPSINSSFQNQNLDKQFNEPRPVEKYKVSLGFDKDTMEYVGDLERQSTGYHILEMKSDKDYKRACVYIGKTLVSCVNI